MRVLVKATVPTETGNARAKEGVLLRRVQQILEEQRPEAAYFCAVDGKRTAFLVLDLDSPAHLPAIVEPWFLAFGADVEVYPTMNKDDLVKAGPGIEKAIKSYG